MPMSLQHRVLGIGLAACVLAAAGCRQNTFAGDTFEKGEVVRRAGGPERYSQIVEKYNARVVHLNTFWSRADLRLEYLNEDGERQRDEAEATIQYELPSKFSFMISKLAEHYFTLGCDAERYWWIDRKVTPPTVVFGRHAAATREKVALLGVPVLPLEIVECLGVTPLPTPPNSAETQWSPLRQLIVFRLPAGTGRGGEIEYWLDPTTLDPARIRIFDAAGKVTIDCRHEVPTMVDVGGRPDGATRIAAKLRVLIPQRETTLTISLNSMENRSMKNSKAFDLVALRAAYRVVREIDLDSVKNADAVSQTPAGAKK